MSTVTAYGEIVERLSAKRKGLRQPLRLPVEQDLAGEFSVARDTVRRALQVLESHGAVTRRRGRGTFLQPLRVNLKKLHGATIGFVLPDWADVHSEQFTGTVFNGTARWADEEGCRLSILHADGEVDVPAWEERVDQRDLAGLLWVHPRRAQLPLIAATAKRLPSVVMGRRFPVPGCCHVLPDYAQATRLIDDYLVEQGHTRYAVVTVDCMEAYSANVVEGFEAAFAARGATFDTHSHLVDVKGFDRHRLGEMLLDYYHPVHGEIKAYVATTSSFLTGILAEDRFRARIASGEISVVAIDYGLHPMESYWPGHAVSHIACDWGRIARRAVETLAMLAAGHDVPETKAESVTFCPGDTIHPFTG